MGVRATILIILLFLAACEPALQTTPTSDYQIKNSEPVPEPVNLCADVTCSDNEECYQGDCVCETGYKSCDGSCIPEDSCCTTADCDTGTCEEGVCVLDCPYGEVFKNGECTCAPDRIFCPEQDKCILRDACCIHTQCDNFERCVPDQFRTRLCLETENKTICRVLDDVGRDDFVTIEDEDYRIEGINWFNDGSVTFQINNQTLNLANNEQETINGILFYHEGIEELGGFCKDDDVD